MIETILEKYQKENNSLTDLSIYELLSAKGDDREAIFAAARNARAKYFGNEIFLYGFVYFSTYCQNHCNFCYYRNSNSMPPRYRKSTDEIIETAVELKESGVHLIDLTMGEDLFYLEHPEKLIEIVKLVKEETDLPVMVSAGVVSDDCIERLAEVGADWYALYQETHNKSLFSKLRSGQDYDGRMHCKLFARKNGMLIEEGILTGVGEAISDRIHSFREMGRVNAKQIRTMTFIPQDGIPMQKNSNPEFSDELLNIAVMRLIYPDKLIPASLDVDGLNGLESRLMAGANVITSIIPPKKGYAGVAHAVQDIDEGYRTVSGVQEIIQKCGLISADAASYKEKIGRWKNI